MPAHTARRCHCSHTAAAMVPCRVLLACVAFGAAVVISPAAGKPTPPPCDLSIVSKQKQVGVTAGGASVSAKGATSGSGSITCITKTPTSVTKKVVAGNAGVSGAAAAAGNGVFKNLVTALTNITTADDITKVQTQTVGSGATGGAATILQLADANGGAALKEVKLDLLPIDTGLAVVKQTKQGQVTSSSSHKASGLGNSVLKVLNAHETELTLKGI